MYFVTFYRLSFNTTVNIVNIYLSNFNIFYFCQICFARTLNKCSKIVKALSDQIIVMRNGQVIEEGSAKEIFLKPKESYTKKLIQSAFI